MYDFVFFLKTYDKDCDRAKRLIASYKNYNMDNIPLYLACPEKDLKLFTEIEGDGVVLLPEEEICQEVFTEDVNWTAGYLNQAIYKLAFWEMRLCTNYMCIDSDAIFIRPFYKKEFMYDEETPYTILVEDNDLRADHYYNKLYWNGRMMWIEKIQDVLDFHPNKLLTCHGFQIFSAKVLESMKGDFLNVNGYTYKQILEIAPYEFTWYNMWLQKTKCISIYQVEPFFKTFHLKQHHIAAVLQGMKLEDWAKGYIGIVVNSNYGIGEGEYDDLMVYHCENADIPDDIIITNYRFYKRLKQGILLRHIRTTITRIGKKVRGLFNDVR